MKLGSPIEQRTFRIFLSSGDDAKDLRDRVDALVRDAINSQLLDADVRVRLEVDRWERTAAQRAAPGRHTNDLFVQRALSSNVTLTLLLDAMGDGTKEELEAVLDADNEVSALWFIPRDESPSSEVADFLRPHRERLYHDKTGDPQSDESWIGIVRVLTRVLIEGLSQPREELFLEQRG